MVDSALHQRVRVFVLPTVELSGGFMNNLIRMERAYLPECTLGVLTVEGGYQCRTIEPPWNDNQRKISCIPEGTYIMRKRVSPIVQRTTQGAHTEGWEVTNVAGRTFIMVHVGNWVRNTDGCILPGKGIGFTRDDGLMVTNSRTAFDELMTELESQDEWILKITTKRGD